MRRERHAVLGPVVLLICVALAAINLRPSISAVGPVLDQILTYVHAGGAVGGILTAIPGMFFAIFGLLAVRIARHVGLTGALVLGMGVLFFGQLLRPWIPNATVFLLLSALAVAGIALGNVLLPAWIKTHGGSATVRLMTLYTCVLGLGGSLGPVTALVFKADGASASAASASLSDPAPWQLALFAWVGVAVLQLVVWLPLWRKVRYDYPPEPAESGPHVGVWRSGTAVALMLFFGLQSMNAYIQMGWLPTMLMDAGVTSRVAVLVAVLVNAMGVVGGLVMPVIIAHSRALWRYTVGFSVLTGLGWIMVALIVWRGAGAFPGAFVYGAAIVLGVGGFCFPTAIALIPARTIEPSVTARLSGFVQPLGYVLAAAGPFFVGTGAELLRSWVPVLGVLVLLAVAMGMAGYRAARPVAVDEELRAPA